MVVRAAVLADTHVRLGSSRRLSDAAYAEIDRADVILHAGDVLVPELLHELGGFAPVHAVLGNNDHALVGVLPEARTIDLAGVTVAMVHDSGPTRGRAGRMYRRFPHAQIVVFGHSHQPVDDEGVDGQRLFNPGSPTERRRAATHTIGVLEACDGHLVTHRLVDV